jgi:hypothetical protein
MLVEFGTALSAELARSGVLGSTVSAVNHSGCCTRSNLCRLSWFSARHQRGSDSNDDDQQYASENEELVLLYHAHQVT